MSGEAQQGPVPVAELLARHAPAGAAAAAAVEDGLSVEARTRAEAQAAAAEVEARQAAIRVDVWSRMVAESWAEYAQANVAQLDASQHGPALAAWFVGDAPTLLLAGTTGSGKTHAAIAMGHHACATGAWVRAYTHRGYLRGLMPDDDREEAREARRLLRKRAREAGLLILDDLGAEMRTDQAASEHTAGETLSLLGDRLTAGLRTIITTNLNAGQMARMFGDRIVSRLRQGDILRFTGPDRRAHVPGEGREGRGW